MSFPELIQQQVERLLHDRMRINDSDISLFETAKRLAEFGVVSMQEYQYVLCVNLVDPDYLSVEDFGCEERIYFDSAEETVYCPACGRYIEDLSKKQVFVEHEISLNIIGVSNYIKETLNNVSDVVSVDEVRTGVYEIKFQNALRLMIVMPEMCSDLEYRSRGLFFGEPCAYLTISSLHCDIHTVLEQNQHLKLSDLLCEPASNIEDCLKLAAVPIVGRRDFGDISSRFDAMMERHKIRGWQFFEQDFIPNLLKHISENPALVESYLQRLKRLNGTIWGDYYVPVGGAGQPDSIPINKFEIMNQVCSGSMITDAKHYGKASLSRDDVNTVFMHLNTSVVQAHQAVIFMSSDQVVSTAWIQVAELKRNFGKWKIIIVPRYLLFELIDALSADLLLDA